MEMNKFNKIYNKIVAESESLGRPNPPSRPNPIVLLSYCSALTSSSPAPR